LLWLAAGGRSEKGTKEKGAAACVQTQFPCLLIYVLYTAADGSASAPALLHQDSLQATGAYSQVLYILSSNTGVLHSVSD